MSSSGYIEFQTGQIADIAQSTQGSQAEWDRVWNDVRSRLSNVVSQALDALTGSSLEDRNQRYHQRTQAYTADLTGQQVAVRSIGDIAVDTNQQMTRVIGG